MILLVDRMLGNYRIPVHHRLNETLNDQFVLAYGQQSNSAKYLTQDKHIFTFRMLKLENH